MFKPPTRYRDDIVTLGAIRKVGPPRQKKPRAASDAPSRSAGHRLNGGVAIRPRFDFHKSDEPPAFRHNIDFSERRLMATGKDRKPFKAQTKGRQHLCAATGPLSRLAGFSRRQRHLPGLSTSARA